MAVDPKDLTKEEIVQAYRLFLARMPSEAELARMQERKHSYNTLRQSILSSEEFARKYERMQKTAAERQTPTLIHLHIPKTAGTSLARALKDEVGAGRLKTGALHKLIDGYQAAFEAQDRSLEPEGWLALTAAHVLAPIHDWAEEIREVAPYFAAARRSDSKAYGPILPPAPKPIRPAIAHFRLRKLYIEGKTPNAVQKRLSVLQAIRSGKV